MLAGCVGKATGPCDAGDCTSGDGGNPSGSDGGTGTDGGTSGDGGVRGQVLVWVFVDWTNALQQIAAHAEDFTQVSPTFYDINYDYDGGVAQYWTGSDNFGGLSSAAFCDQVHTAGLQCIPLVFGGADNAGTDQGIQNILNDSPAGTQASFISSMVAEGQGKSYDGYNLDWEVSNSQTTYSGYGAKLETFLAAFKSALHAQGMTLSVDLGTWFIKQTNCSGGNGVVDLTAIAANVDWAILEDYDTMLGTASTSCPTSWPDPSSCTEDFIDDLDLMCVYLPPGVMSIGLDSKSSANNPIAGSVFSALASYGVSNIAVWPDSNSDGPGGQYLFLTNADMSPAGADWFSLLHGFRAQAP
jgi:hypothetical protein